MKEETASLERRKALGLFYTPKWLADLLVSWACPSGTTNVLDPSFGGCAFLLSAYRELTSQGVEGAGAGLFGVDIDPGARQFARALLDVGVPSDNLEIDNFLTTTFVADRQFDAVIGNPPYVRHHSLEDAVVDIAQQRLHRDGIVLPRTASAWAYFAIMAAQRVKVGGRLALILPGTTLHSDYASCVIATLSEWFNTMRILHVHERLFEATQEESVIILGACKGQAGVAQYRRVRGRSDLAAALHDQAKDSSHSLFASYKLNLLPSSVIDAWQGLVKSKSLLTLGSLCRIRIGVVTGANQFFIRSRSDEIFQSRFVTRYPIVAGRSWLRSPVFEKRNFRFLDEADVHCWLAIISGRGDKRAKLARLLQTAEDEGIAARQKCALRSPWFRLDDYEVPQLFLPYMGSTAPRLVVNKSPATCTNAIHRVWIERRRADLTSVAASSYTGLFAFEAELFGRHYGGGILKLEPSAAQRLHVVPKAAKRAFPALVALAHDPVQQAALADDIIFKDGLGFSLNALREIRAGLELLVRERSRIRAEPEQVSQKFTKRASRQMASSS